MVGNHHFHPLKTGCLFRCFGGKLGPQSSRNIGGRDHVITPHVTKNTGTCHVSGKTLLGAKGVIICYVPTFTKKRYQLTKEQTDLVSGEGT